MNEYRIKVSIRNNLLLSAIETAGYKSQSEFARVIGENPQTLSALVSLRMPPIGADGEFCKIARTVMEVLGAAPSDLWTDEQLYMRLERSSGERAASVEQVKALLADATAPLELEAPEDLVSRGELGLEISNAISELSKREQVVMRKRFFHEQTLDDVAMEMDVTKERVRQIEASALRKLRKPRVAARLLQFCAPHEHTTEQRARELRIREEQRKKGGGV